MTLVTSKTLKGGGNEAPAPSAPEEQPVRYFAEEPIKLRDGFGEYLAYRRGDEVPIELARKLGLVPEVKKSPKPEDKKAPAPENKAPKPPKRKPKE